MLCLPSWLKPRGKVYYEKLKFYIALSSFRPRIKTFEQIPVGFIAILNHASAFHEGPEICTV
jgi:hypothetical protein